MAGPLLQTVQRLPLFRWEMRMPWITTEIFPKRLNLGQIVQLLFEIGNFSAWNFVNYREAGEDSNRQNYSPKK